MGLALITDVAAASNPSSSVTAATAGAGSSLTVRNSSLTSPVTLLDMWRKGATAGIVQLVSPKLVPISHGIQYACPAALADFLFGGPPYQPLTPQDILQLSLTGGGSETDLGVIQSYYQDLPGVSMTLKMPGDIAGQTEFMFGWEVNTTASATEGDQASTVITNLYDGSTANRWYAVLGYTVDAALATVGISGIDTSASYIAGPGDTDRFKTRNYFADLSMRTGMPCIPLWNAANKSNTNVVTTDSAASTTANVTLVLAQLVASYNP
ncbi:MAG TPA: hypothetical protein VGG07_25195 [Solirubrobacteraceae bacterium]|jgi:hypothetical protein